MSKEEFIPPVPPEVFLDKTNDVEQIVQKIDYEAMTHGFQLESQKKKGVDQDKLVVLIDPIPEIRKLENGVPIKEERKKKD